MSAEDTLTRRQVFLQRFAEGEAARAEEVLTRIYAKANARISLEPEAFGTANHIRLTQDLQALMGREFDEMNEGIRQSVLELAEDEAAFTTKALQDETSVLLSQVDLHAVDQAVFNRGMDAVVGAGKLTLNEALEQFATNKRQELLIAINDGILLGETTPEIAKRVQELASKRPAHQVRSLVRTTINHASSMARKAVVEENQAFFENEEWIATLDSRTTLICAGRDGNIYPLGQGPYPPAHWGCRSLRLPILKDEFVTEPQGTKRPSEVDSVTGQTKFDGWLRRQPADFQDEYFSQFADGLDKAALFRRGGLEIQQFRTETGANYTLDELRNLNPLAFTKANIE